jgi:DNA-binding IclR family transcriptional regulator
MMTADDRLVARIRGEFIEMPGFAPTLPQAVRLFQLSRDDCSRVLLHLVEEGFLHRTLDDRYRRTSSAPSTDAAHRRP